jgi:type IV pilus assembly protein PilZ
MATIKSEGHEPREALVRDMSLSGAFIEADLPFGIVLSLQVELSPATSVTIAAVARWNKPDGTGVQFGQLGARDTYLITEYLAAMEPVPDSRRPDTD